MDLLQCPLELAAPFRGGVGVVVRVSCANGMLTFSQPSETSSGAGAAVEMFDALLSFYQHG